MPEIVDLELYYDEIESKQVTRFIASGLDMETFLALPDEVKVTEELNDAAKELKRLREEHAV